jgi:hypothetical protein
VVSEIVKVQRFIVEEGKELNTLWTGYLII